MGAFDLIEVLLIPLLLVELQELLSHLSSVVLVHNDSHMLYLVNACRADTETSQGEHFPLEADDPQQLQCHSLPLARNLGVQIRIDSANSDSFQQCILSPHVLSRPSQSGHVWFASLGDLGDLMFPKMDPH